MRAVKCRHLMAVFALLFLIGTGLPVFTVQAAGGSGNVSKKVIKKNQDFKVSAEYGIDGLALYDKPALVQVTLESSRNFTGSVRLIPSMNYGRKTVAYGEDISLAGGEAKTFTFVPTSLSDGEVRIEILNEKDKVVYSELDTVSMSSAGDRFLTGVLSDDYSALNYFDGVAVSTPDYEGLVNTLELKPDNLQTDSSAIAILDCIIIDNFDTANLSDEQYVILKEWVNNGGRLILSLGSNYQNVLHRFSDGFITGSFGDLEKRELQWIIAAEDAGFLNSRYQNSAEDWEEEAADDAETAADSADEADPDAKENGSSDAGESEETTDITESEKTDVEESGTIDPATIEPEGGIFTLPGVDVVPIEVEEAQEMTAFSTDGTAYRKDIGAGSVIVLSYALGMEPFTGYADRKLVAGLLLNAAAGNDRTSSLNAAGYMLSDVSVGAGLARSADDTRKPSVLLYGGLLILYVILVGPVLYLVLKAMNKREKIWAAIPVMSLLFTGVIYLTGFLYRVRIPIVNTFSVVALEDGFQTENVYTSVTCPKAQDYALLVNKEYSGFYYDMYDYEYSVFSGYRGGDSSEGGFDYMMKKKNDGMEILFHNDEAFDENSFVVSKTTDNMIGMIECDLHCYTTGFEGTITNHTSYDLVNVVVNFEDHFYQAGDLKKGEQVTIDQSKLIAASYGTFRDLYLSSSTINMINSSREMNRKYQVDTAMEDSFVNIRNYNHGCLWAIIDGYEPDLSDSAQVKQNGFGVIYQDFTAEYEDMESVYYPDLNRMILTSQGGYDEQDGMLYDTDVTITYSFDGYPGITVLENASYGLTPPYYGAYADVYAYNAQTGDYEAVFVNGSDLSGDTLQKYVNGNILILQYRMDNSTTSYIPRIVARGDE